MPCPSLVGRLVEWSFDAVVLGKTGHAAASFPVIGMADPEVAAFPVFGRALVSHAELVDIIEDFRNAA